MPVTRTTGTRNPQRSASRGETITIKPFAAVTKAARTKVAEATAKKLIGYVETHKDVAGNGQESAAKGDPRVTERRRLLATALADKSNKFVKRDVLEALGPNVKADIKWLIDAERSEYTVDGSGQFAWAQSVMSSGTAIERHFKGRVQAQQKMAEQLTAGARKYFDADQGSVVGITSIADPNIRANSLVDALLQFRADASSAPSDRRVDLVGPSVLAEQRIVLANADLSDLSKPEVRRELGLLRSMIASHPNNSVNGIFEARNAVAAIFLDGGDAQQVYSARRNGNTDFKTSWIIHEKPPGTDVSPYSSIHHNFSTSTPKVISSMVTNWLFPVGDEAYRAQAFLAAVDVLELAVEGKGAEAKTALADLDGNVGTSLTDLKKAVENVPDAKMGEAVLAYLTSVSTKDLGDNPATNLQMASALYRSVCEDRPSREGLAEELFKAGDAWPELADVLFALDSKDDLLLLRELGEVRIALRDTIAAAKTGFERHEMILLDAEVDRMVLEELGSAVNRIGNHGTDAEKSEALWAMATALRSAVASGLDVMRGKDSTQGDKRTLDELRGEIEKILESGSISEGAYRGLMAEIRVAVTTTVQDIRAFVDERAADVAADGLQLDPEFLDQFVKQSALHYATAIADKGMTVGLKEDVSADRIANVEGMRVLNSIGRVVFSSVIAADNTKELAELKPPKDALTVVYQLQEKKMVAVGGLIVDTEHAPGGNSHLNMYAMNNGIAVLALPELRTKYAEFFANAAKPESEGGGGIYMAEHDGEFQMLTVARAKADGLLKADEVEELRPGLNRRIEYLKSNAAGDSFDVIGKHEAIISDERRTREVQLYVPMDEVKGLGKRCVSFDELASIGTHGRHLAGEKGLVLALLRSNPKLRDSVPDGSIVTTGRVRSLLKETPVGDGTLNDMWNDVWTNDPKVGTVDDANIHNSAFYTDKDYRAAKREALQSTTKEALTSHLIATDADGKKTLTDAGKKLYEELTANPTLANAERWITRSSFTGEDRPGKSGAGQYESFPNLKDPVSRIEGVIGVIESTWMPEPIENNIADEVDLRYIMPSVTVQDCLNPTESGVMISRDIANGARNQVSYQLVKGFGGGVEGGKTEEGLIRANGHQVLVEYPDAPNGLVPPEALKELRDIVLEVERYFHETVEPGKGYAVDMEVARENEQWKVVQARVILMDH